MLLASGLLLMGTSLRGQRFQEPQWEMPFYFEDALGQRDTIWIGYDPSASLYLWVIDPQFDEGWKWIDTTRFNVFLTYKGWEMGLERGDSVKKRDITSWPFLIDSPILGVTHGQLPVVMKWNDSLLNSVRLPSFYPPIPDRPRARIDINTRSGMFPTVCSGMFPYPPIDVYPTVICSGYEGYIWEFCHFRDSLIFSNEGWNFTDCNTMIDVFAKEDFTFLIAPFNFSYVGIDEETKIEYALFPNPTTGMVTIQNDLGRELTIGVFDLSGKELLHNKSTDTKIAFDISGLSNGVYIVRIANGTTINHHKVIKQ
ncbi:MAG TPA: T9SS type A sorting domain-containing protein [Salinivirgaceae bacterium]|nr:T9SS type A sorting domain-containing protein [Salinivirgaceae bacterium]